MVGTADRMAWKRCCCCRVSSLWRVLAVSWAVLGAYAISLTIYYNPTWDTLSWDTSNVKVDLSPRQDLRFRSRGNSTTSAQNILYTISAAVELVWSLLGLLACTCSLLASLCNHEKLLLPLLAWIPLEFAFSIYSISSCIDLRNSNVFQKLFLLSNVFKCFFYLFLFFALWWFVVSSHRHHLRREHQRRNDGPGPLINHMLV